ncbi:MAG: acyl-CoA thioesterase/BAAT N-terminal domain-containing protein [Caulobacterales bacterium]
MLAHFRIRHVVLALALLGGCQARETPSAQPPPPRREMQAPTGVTITVAPNHPLMDQRLSISINGLPPSRPVSVTARAKAADGLWWRSQAVFMSDGGGRVDPAAQAPVSGAYRGVDGMGLFWSMGPDIEPKKSEHAYFDMGDPSKPNETLLEVTQSGRVVASTDVWRRFVDPGVHASAASDGLEGVLYSPNDGAAHPAVLIIGGSDGGPGAPNVAMLLASHGFTTLSIAYFGEKNLPATLQRVPMEYFAHALDWLRRQPSVDPRFVAIYGESRGTEPALWIAANDQRVSAVVARSPSFALWGGVTANHLPGGAAWTHNGKDLPFIANRISVGFAAQYLADMMTRTPVRQTALFLEDLRGFGDTSAVEIPVEKIRGPVLLLAGRGDQIWPSELMARRIMARLGGRHPYTDAMVAYDDVGHPVPYVYAPLEGDRRHVKFAVGGTVEGAAKAQADAWPRILAFLETAAHRALTVQFH